MELYSLQVLLAVATEKSFSRAAEKLLRTQPAVSLGIQKLEHEMGEKLIDRSGKDLMLTDAGSILVDYARRFENLEGELRNALAELRDKSAGRLSIGANESTTLYLLRHIERYRKLYPKVKVQVRRSLSSKIPGELIDGNLELGVISYDPADERLQGTVIYTDALAFIVSPRHRLARRQSVSMAELGSEMFIAHNVVSPYREVVLREFHNYKVRLNMEVEMPTIETIRKLVQANLGVAFVPRMCVEQEILHQQVCEVQSQGTARGAQDPAGVSDAPRPEPRGAGLSRSRQERVAAVPSSLPRAPGECYNFALWLPPPSRSIIAIIMALSICDGRCSNHHVNPTGKDARPGKAGFFVIGGHDFGFRKSGRPGGRGHSGLRTPAAS